MLSTVLIEGAWSPQPEAVCLRASRSPPTRCRASTPRHDDGALLTDNVRDEQTTRPQGRMANTGDLMESQG